VRNFDDAHFYRGRDGNLAVHINALTSGIHSAIVRLDDAASTGIEYQTLNTVVAAEQFSGPGYSVSKTGTPDRADMKAFFINVQPGTPVLQLNETITGGRTRLDVTDPFGLPYLKALPCGCALDYTTAPGSKTLSIPNPMAGVWEIDIEASRSAPTPTSNTSFTASELGVSLTPSSWKIDPATIGSTYTQKFSFTNLFGAFTGSATGTPLGSAFRARPTATDPPPNAPDDPTQEFKIAVPAGATSLHVEIGNPVEPNTDLDLYVFDEAGNLVGQSAGSSAHEVVNISNPAAGTYTAVVDDFDVGGSGTTLYDYTDVFALPTLGSVTTDDVVAPHPAGSTWTANVSVKPLGSPGPGRFLQGFVDVTSGGASVGRAEVDLLVH